MSALNMRNNMPKKRQPALL